MVSVKAILAFFLVISIFANIFLLFQNMTLTSEKDNTIILGREVKSLLTNSRISCRATENEPYNLAQCVRNMREIYERKPFEETGYRNYDTRNQENGYIILKILAPGSWNSEKFTLLKNRELADTGCVITGNLTKDETCKLFFDSDCERGDILEVQYNEKRIHLKNC